MKKYELTDEKMNYFGRTLYRIKALQDFGNILAGHNPTPKGGDL